MVHVRISEKVDDSFESSYLPIDSVVVLFVEFKFHDELVVDSAAALVLLDGDVEGTASHPSFAVLSFYYEVPARYMGF